MNSYGTRHREKKNRRTKIVRLSCTTRGEGLLPPSTPGLRRDEVAVAVVEQRAVVALASSRGTSSVRAAQRSVGERANHEARHRQAEERARTRDRSGNRQRRRLVEDRARTDRRHEAD